MLEGLQGGAHDVVVYLGADQLLADLAFRFEPWVAELLRAGAELLAPCQHAGSPAGETEAHRRSD